MLNVELIARTLSRLLHWNNVERRPCLIATSIMLGSRAQHQTHLFQLQLLPSLRDKQDVLLTSNVHIVKKIFNVKCTYVYLVQFNSAPPETVYFISSKVQVCLVTFQLFWGQLYKVIQVYVSHGFIDSTNLSYLISSIGLLYLWGVGTQFWWCPRSKGINPTLHMEPKDIWEFLASFEGWDFIYYSEI